MLGNSKNFRRSTSSSAPASAVPSAVTVAGLPIAHAARLWAAEGEGPPNSPLDPTKNTPSQIAVLDQDEAIVLSEEEGRFIKIKLRGKKLNGFWIAMQQEESKMWTFQQSKLPEPIRA
jgi:hypothetical protein